VPHFYAILCKRWYCSGFGAAEALARDFGADPFRQLSDKSCKKLGNIEIYHPWSFLVLAVVMTTVTDAKLFSGVQFLGKATQPVTFVLMDLQ